MEKEIETITLTPYSPGKRDFSNQGFDHSGSGRHEHDCNNAFCEIRVSGYRDSEGRSGLMEYRLIR